MAKRLTSEFHSGDGLKIPKLRKPLIVSLLFRRIWSTPSCILFFFKKYIRILRAVLNPPGILIATAGPDGAGKSTLLGRVGAVLSETFYPIKKQYMGWKYFILPTKRLLRRLQNTLPRSGGGRKSTSGPVQDNHPSWAHNFSVLHYLLDLWARYLLEIRPVLARGGLVLCDRYFFDFLVQDVWICRNFWARRILSAMTPQPSVAILLSGDPEAIAARKRENSTAETQRQIAAFALLTGNNGAVLELDATDALNDNVSAVLDFLFKRPNSEKEAAA
jgi:thymidylate kinase